MEIKKPNVGDILLDSDKTFMIPPYQRGYQWKSDRWQALIQDILKKVTSPEKQHWIGIIITSESGEQSPARSYRHKYFDIIDGQQRIVTLRLWLQAVIDHARENSIELENELDLTFAELICQEADKHELQSVLNQQWRQKWRTYNSDSSGLMHCYTYFRWILWLGEAAILTSEPDPLPKKSRSEVESTLPIEQQWGKALIRRSVLAADLEENEEFQYQVARSTLPNCDALIKATLNDLSLVELERQDALDEDPAEIFEALNGQRLSLGQFDHVRNYIFTGIRDSDHRRDLYENHWKFAELALHKSNISSRGSSQADTFLYDFLISLGETKYQKSFSKMKTAIHFARYFDARTNGNHEMVSKEILLPSLIAWMAVKLNGEKIDVNNESYVLDSECKRRLRIMDSLSSGPLVPILMLLVKRRFSGQISDEALNRQLFLLEVFLGRKVLKRSALSPLRSEIMALAGRLSTNFSEIELKAALELMTPTDAQIRTALGPATISRVTKYPETAKLGQGLKSKQLLGIFQAIETHLSGPLRHNLLENHDTEAFSIEHIFPQESEYWRDELRRWSTGVSFLESRMHVLGNLGVIPKRLNSELSNQSFTGKREVIASPENDFPNLRVNEYWTKSTQIKWLPSDIDARGDQLLNVILRYWKF